MSTEELVFKHPPATEVQIQVGFPNNLEVADHRGRFHKLVRAEFPNAIIPEQNKLPYDFGDYILQRQDGTERIEANANSFRLISYRYPGFKKFRESFIKSLDTFAGCHEIQSFYLLMMSFKNALPLEPGSQFKDCFALKISLPDMAESELFAGQGILVFQKPEGLVTIQLEPKIEKNAVLSYSMNLMFTTQRDFSDLFDKSLVSSLADTAHDYLKALFLRILTKSYVEYLRAR